MLAISLSSGIFVKSSSGCSIDFTPPVLYSTLEAIVPPVVIIETLGSLGSFLIFSSLISFCFNPFILFIHSRF